MKTITISTSYSLKWQIKGYSNYAVSDCGHVFNVKTSRMIKRVRNGGSIGYCIDGKFYTLKSLRKMLEKITEFDLPF